FLHRPMKWPEGTPDDVKALADELARVLKGRNGQVVGPAIALVFAYVVAELGNAPPRPGCLLLSLCSQDSRLLHGQSIRLGASNGRGREPQPGVRSLGRGRGP